MADSIDRNASIRFISNIEREDEDRLFTFEEIKKMLRDAPAVNRWIPCSQRMPENCTKVLVWFEYFRYGEYNCMYSTWGIGEYFDFSGRWLIDDSTGWQDLHVFAWMPLPEPPEVNENA